MLFLKINFTFDVLTNHLILTKMKKLKLIFGLLIVAAFVSVTLLSNTSSEVQAIEKNKIRVLPTNG